MKYNNLLHLYSAFLCTQSIEGGISSTTTSIYIVAMNTLRIHTTVAAEDWYYAARNWRTADDGTV